MSGPQFLHLQSYSRKPNKIGQSVQQILDEAAREPQFEICPKVGDGPKGRHIIAVIPKSREFSEREDMPPWPNLQLFHLIFHRSFHLIL